VREPNFPGARLRFPFQKGNGMGRFIDLNSPLSQVDIDYLKSRGRTYLLDANFRRFGTPDEPRTPEAHEAVVGSPAQSPFYQSDERNAAVYDKGGVPLPGATLDYDTGRAYDRENGVTADATLLEFNPVGHTSGAHPSPYTGDDSGFSSTSDGDDDIDDDIVEEIQAIPNKTELKKRLDKEGVEYEASGSREELEDALAIHLQDQRGHAKA
jgi:hypothetical protein